MADLNLKWEKCPSVMTGGKAYFYSLLYQGNRYHVVWDRLLQAWKTTCNHVTFGHNHKTQKAGREYVIKTLN